MGKTRKRNNDTIVKTTKFLNKLSGRKVTTDEVNRLCKNDGVRQKLQYAATTLGFCIKTKPGVFKFNSFTFQPIHTIQILNYLDNENLKWKKPNAKKQAYKSNSATIFKQESKLNGNQCLNCSENLVGRSDKHYCNTKCRNIYINRLAYDHLKSENNQKKPIVSIPSPETKKEISNNDSLDETKISNLLKEISNLKDNLYKELQSHIKTSDEHIVLLKDNISLNKQYDQLQLKHKSLETKYKKLESMFNNISKNMMKSNWESMTSVVDYATQQTV